MKISTPMTRPATTFWTADRDVRLAEMRNARTPFATIAAEIGCTVKVAEERSRILRQAGVDVWVGNSLSKKTLDLIARFRSMAAEGKSSAEAGAAVGISPWTARKWLKSADRAPTTPKPATPTGGTSVTSGYRHIIWTAETDKKLIDMRNAQSSWDKIAAALNVAQSTVYNRALVLRDRGVAMWGAPESVRSVREAGSTRTDLSPMPPLHPVSWSAVCEPWETFNARVCRELRV